MREYKVVVYVTEKEKTITDIRRFLNDAVRREKELRPPEQKVTIHLGPIVEDNKREGSPVFG